MNNRPTYRQIVLDNIKPMEKIKIIELIKRIKKYMIENNYEIHQHLSGIIANVLYCLRNENIIAINNKHELIYID